MAVYCLHKLNSWLVMRIKKSPSVKSFFKLFLISAFKKSKTCSERTAGKVTISRPFCGVLGATMSAYNFVKLSSQMKLFRVIILLSVAYSWSFQEKMFNFTSLYLQVSTYCEGLGADVRIKTFVNSFSNLCF